MQQNESENIKITRCDIKIPYRHYNGGRYGKKKFHELVLRKSASLIGHVFKSFSICSLFFSCL